MKSFFSIDKQFLAALLSLLVLGLFFFSSAALGILAREETKFYNILLNQLIFAFFAGIAAFIIGSFIPYKKWRQFAYFIFFLTAAATLLVFIKDFGFAHGGARRWIYIFGISIQPGEFLKFGTIILLSAWFATYRHKINSFTYGLFPFLAIVGIPAAIFMMQPDTGTFLVILGAAIILYLVSGAPYSHFFSLSALSVGGILILSELRPYLKTRLMTFWDPTQDPLGASYQIQQSLISIGSGGIFGRGFGQSIQKFSYLPEPVGDSIFAVIGEEVGLIGALFVITLFIFFAMRCVNISKNSPDTFGAFLSLGLGMLITVQAFLNIGSMLGVTPLTGVPLPFISHGGTALLMNLFEAGVIANVSKHIS